MSNPELDFKSSVLPGQLYNAHMQCQLALGNQYSAYFSSKTPFNVNHLIFIKLTKFLIKHF